MSPPRDQVYLNDEQSDSLEIPFATWRKEALQPWDPAFFSAFSLLKSLYLQRPRPRTALRSPKSKIIKIIRAKTPDSWGSAIKKGSGSLHPWGCCFGIKGAEPADDVHDLAFGAPASDARRGAPADDAHARFRGLLLRNQRRRASG